MNRAGFIEELRACLNDIPESEMNAAIEYYEGYFEDAGPENEDKIIEELKSPEEVAKMIKAEIFEEENMSGNSLDNVLSKSSQANEYNGTPYNFDEKKNEYETEDNKGLKIFAVILIGIVAMAVLPTGFGLIAGVLGTLIGFIAIVLSVCVAGTVLIISGIIQCFMAPLLGMAMLGSGFILFGVGLLLGRVIVKFLKWLIPVSVKVCKDLIKGMKILLGRVNI